MENKQPDGLSGLPKGFACTKKLLSWPDLAYKTKFAVVSMPQLAASNISMTRAELVSGPTTMASGLSTHSVLASWKRSRNSWDALRIRHG
jgi:hypothetical protein